MDEQERPISDENPTESIIRDGASDYSSGIMPLRQEYHDPVPEQIGVYRVHGQIGRGGMGVVLKASRGSGAGTRLVAIKLVRKGTDTADVLERFAVERQVLSALDHPNIARFIEAGETDDGRPYFVMEYIEGQPITAYCDANNLPLRKRLEVFAKVCEAVHYAHTNLVVHRDLKPENIIVTPEGEPKLLDFGIAKLLNPALSPVIAVTGPHMRLMTPEYASPEQVKGEPVNTLSDVYSLGVLLYELLSGHRPYRLRSRLEAEIIRVICETDPDRPSTAVSRIEEIQRHDGTTNQVTPDSVAERRGHRPSSLRKQLSGDLDDIILLAMNKAPAARYASVRAFAEDIDRHIRGEPVRARSARRRGLYVARKFVSRHRTAVTATAAALLVLVAMGGVSLAQYRQTTQARLEATQSDLEAAQARNEELIRGAFGSVLWNNFSNRIIDVNLSASSREELWRSIIADMESLRETHGTDNPIVREEFAKALKELGDVLGGRRTGNVGDSKGALEAYTRASDLYEALAEENPDDHALRYRAGVASIYKGDLLRDLNRSEEASAAYNLANDILTRLPDEGEWADRKERALSVVLLTHAQMAGRACMIDEAIETCRRSIAVRESRAERNPESELAQRDVAIGLVNLGEILLVAGDTAAAEDAFRRALSIRAGLLERMGPDKRRHRDVAVSSLALAGSLHAQGRHQRAQALLDDAHAVLATLVAENPDDAILRDLLCRTWITRAEGALNADEPNTALEACERGQAVHADLVNAAPGNASNEGLESELLLAAGRAHAALSQPDEAATLLEACARICESVLSADPGRAAYQRRLATAAAALADLESSRAQTPGIGSTQAEDHRAEALAWYRRAARIYDDMTTADRLCGVDAREVERVRDAATP